jgi:hypothetical protein
VAVTTVLALSFHLIDLDVDGYPYVTGDISVRPWVHVNSI